MIFYWKSPSVECPLEIFVLDGSVSDIVDTHKYLGIWIDSKPTFETHNNTLSLW